MKNKEELMSSKYLVYEFTFHNFDDDIEETEEQED